MLAAIERITRDDPPPPARRFLAAELARQQTIADVLGRAEKELTTLEREPDVAAALRHTLAKSYYHQKRVKSKSG